MFIFEQQLKKVGVAKKLNNNKSRLFIESIRKIDEVREKNWGWKQLKIGYG